MLKIKDDDSDADIIKTDGKEAVKDGFGNKYLIK